MLKLKNIVKNYNVGDETVSALRSVSIEFRKNEFVSILGQSGCGKTTLLNIIGGLDRYTDGDLIISGRSTKEYSDRDWDAYRNHSIGFVFQSYNLIPHQTVLANVELALTLSGVSKAERKKRAVEALNKVGLGNQLKKKPNQMSGGQMQRVAIARALINDPEILLADEPTGALDSETSEQIMELLKEVASDRLVIMVTHNPELAERYSTRIVKLLDGQIIDDTDPYDSSAEAEKPNASIVPAKGKKKNKKTSKPSMSMFTALSLSLNNLMTKKGRTFMTAFAGSIGIIGIALILSVSSGFQAYIDKVQEDTLSTYPITIESETVDMSALMETMIKNSEDNEHTDKETVYANTDMYEMLNAYMNPEITTNDLKSFKAWIDSGESDIEKYATVIQYCYKTAKPRVYSADTSKGILPANDYSALFEGMMGEGSAMPMGNSSMSGDSIKIFDEMLRGSDGELINDLIYSQYELAGDGMSWPKNKNEVVMVLDQNGEISETYLYALGMLDRGNLTTLMTEMLSGKKESSIETRTEWKFDDIVGMKFKLVLPGDLYVGTDTDGDGKNDIYNDMSEDDAYMKLVLSNAEELEIVGIIKPKEDAVATTLRCGIGYTAALTDWYIDAIANSEAVKAQLENPDTDILTGLQYVTEAISMTDAELAADFKDWEAALGTDEKAALFDKFAATPDAETLSGLVAEALKAYPDRAAKETLVINAYMSQSQMDESTVKGLVQGSSETDLDKMVSDILSAAVSGDYAKKSAEKTAGMKPEKKAAEIDAAIGSADETKLLFMREILMPDRYSDSTLKDTLAVLGYADVDSPSSINIYAAEFELKDKIADVIESYNKKVPEEQKINYTDYVELMMSSVSTIINVISYVLMAFVSISLVVSSIMIGIITYISVLERTKEIGILRSIGASKRDISRVFNAETLIVGFVSGMIGILTTLLLNIPINLIIGSISTIKRVAALPVGGAIALVIISMALTLIAGLIPSRVAAKKDPVVALRSE